MTTANLLDKSNWRFFSFSVFWVLLIGLLSLWSGEDLPSAQTYLLAPDKVIHFTLYFVYTFTVFIALKKMGYRSGLKRCNTKAFGSAVILAIITEVLQFLAKSRTFDFNDFLANCFGIIIAALVLRVIVGKEIFLKLN